MVLLTLPVMCWCFRITQNFEGEQIWVFVFLQEKESQSDPEDVEGEAVKNLVARLNLILADEGWSKQRTSTSYWNKIYEPW